MPRSAQNGIGPRSCALNSSELRHFLLRGSDLHNRLKFEPQRVKIGFVTHLHRFGEWAT
jgi:hypothetical protein